MTCAELKTFIKQHPDMSDCEVGKQCGYSKEAVKWHRRQLGIIRKETQQSIDETGNRYGKLTVLYKDKLNAHNDGMYWVCRCDCGNITTVKASNLRCSRTRSCGCDSSKNKIKLWNNGVWKRIDKDTIECCKCGAHKPVGKKTSSYKIPCIKCSPDDWMVHHAHYCKDCGCLIQIPHSSLCPSCKNEHRAERNRQKSIRSNKNRRMHAIRNGRVDSGITFKKIMKRDGNACAICGKPVDMDDYHITKTGRRRPDAMYPSVDHIIPLAKGGTHTWDNVQLAHYMCNALKSDHV